MVVSEVRLGPGESVLVRVLGRLPTTKSSEQILRERQNAVVGKVKEFAQTHAQEIGYLRGGPLQGDDLFLGEAHTLVSLIIDLRDANISQERVTKEVAGVLRSGQDLALSPQQSLSMATAFTNFLGSVAEGVPVKQPVKRK